MSALPPAVATANVPERTLDFADWLSPMLVKELRQGIRSRVFVISFLLLQLAMVLLAIVGLTSAAYDQANNVVSGFFWAFVSVPLLLVMPVTGLLSIGSESKADTLELIFLTRLTARRIILGKWVALVAQSALLVAAVLPYVVLRYFLGGVDLVFELLLLAGMLFVSSTLSAIAVGLSPMPNKWLRVVFVLIFIGGTVTLGIMALVFFLSPLSSFARITASAWLDLFAWVPAAVALMLFMLEAGAGKLAPAAENHSTSLRVIPLISGFIALGFWAWRRSDAVVPLVFITAALQLVAILVGLCERWDRPPSLFRPFVRRGALGKIAGRFLYPGWPSAVMYTLLLTVLWLGALGAIVSWDSPTRSDAGDFGAFAITFIVGVGALLMPMAILQTFWPDAPLRILWFIAIYATCSFVYGLLNMIQNLKGPDLRPVLRILPLGGLLSIMSDDHSNGDAPAALIPSLIGTAMVLVLLFWAMHKASRGVKTLEERAEASLKGA